MALEAKQGRCIMNISNYKTSADFVQLLSVTCFQTIVMSLCQLHRSIRIMCRSFVTKDTYLVALRRLKTALHSGHEYRTATAESKSISSTPPRQMHVTAHGLRADEVSQYILHTTGKLYRGFIFLGLMLTNNIDILHA